MPLGSVNRAATLGTRRNTTMRNGSSPTPSGDGWTLHTRGRDAGTTERWSGSFDDSTHAADVRLAVPARPENVRVVRHLLGVLAESSGMPEAVRADLQLAVTEAVTNVVRHAYRHEGGRVEILARTTDDAFEVIVSDSGAGIVPSPDVQGPGLGLGLISTLADRLEIDHAPGQGSRVQMWFARHRPIPETA